jgi:hypothetical protein
MEDRTMKVLPMTAIALLVCHAVAHGGAFRRHLPEAYVSGRPLTVTLEPTGSYADLSFYVYETIPPGWSLEKSSHPGSLVSFDPETRRILWKITAPEFHIPEMPPLPWGVPILWYEVNPPDDEKGEVVFDGYDGARTLVIEIDGLFLFYPDPDPADNQTGGDTTISDRAGLTLYVPQDYPTIQGATEGSLFGDTIIVTPQDAPYAEDIQLKQGVNLMGSPNSPPPILCGADVAIAASPHARIRGMRICSGRVGVLAGHAVEISNCVVTGTEDAAVEFVGSDEGRVANCAIVSNSGAGVLCQEPSSCVVVANSILLGNGGKDIENCTAKYCLLEDEIDAGWGENNIFGDPMFVNATAGDYRLLPNSPCIDAGDNGAVQADETDILGKPRIMFGGKSETVDMGAYEHWFISLSRAPDTQELQLRWSSAPEKTYTVFCSSDFLSWETADENVGSAGSLTVWSEPIGCPPAVPVRFYTITANE